MLGRAERREKEGRKYNWRGRGKEEEDAIKEERVGLGGSPPSHYLDLGLGFSPGGFCNDFCCRPVQSIYTAGTYTEIQDRRKQNRDLIYCLSM